MESGSIKVVCKYARRKELLDMFKYVWKANVF